MKLYTVTATALFPMHGEVPIRGYEVIIADNPETALRVASSNWSPLEWQLAVECQGDAPEGYTDGGLINDLGERDFLRGVQNQNVRDLTYGD